jgi:hypothetical protein
MSSIRLTGFVGSHPLGMLTAFGLLISQAAAVRNAAMVLDVRS